MKLALNIDVVIGDILEIDEDGYWNWNLKLMKIEIGRHYKLERSVEIDEDIYRSRLWIKVEYTEWILDINENTY